MIKARQTAELPVVVKWGRLLIRGSLAALVVGGAALKAFAPERRGQGLDLVSLIILIPIWGCCLAGTILSLWGWVRHPCLENELDLDIQARSDRRFFGPFTKSLACFTLFLFWLSTFLLLAEPDEAVPLWKRILVCYCSTAYCWFLIYLATLYSPVRHRPTTMYLNNLGPLIGVLLTPLTWFLLLGLNVGQVGQIPFPVQVSERAANKIKQMLRDNPPWQGRAYIRLRFKEREIRGFGFERMVDLAVDLVGEVYGVKFVVSRQAVDDVAGLIIDFQAVGDDASFYARYPNASYPRALDADGV
jgi:Fe-S cluster assembly iron-binding protein IscA